MFSSTERCIQQGDIKVLRKRLLGIKIISVVIISMLYSLFTTIGYGDNVEYPINKTLQSELANFQLSVKSFSEELLTLIHENKNLQEKYELSAISHHLDILLYSVKNLLFATVLEYSHVGEGHISKRATIEFIAHLETEYKLAAISFESLKLISLQGRGSLIEKKANKAMDLVDQYGRIIDRLSKSLTSYINSNREIKR